MIADCRRLDSYHVQHGHHLLPTREGAHERGVEAIAAEQRQWRRVAGGPRAAHRRHKACGPAHGLHRTRLNVVHLTGAMRKSGAAVRVRRWVG